MCQLLICDFNQETAAEVAARIDDGDNIYRNISYTMLV